MSTAECPTCGLPTAALDCAATNYYNTQGGHNDRHTLVVEAVERLIETVDGR